MYDPEQPIFDVQPESTIKPIIGINEKPRTWWETLFYAWQITLVDFTPFIWAGAFVSIAGLPDTVIPIMIRTCFIAMGIGTLIQITIGNRLPIVQGPSASVLTSMGGVTAIYGFPAMWGAVIVGGLIESLIGASRLLGSLRKFIPPVVAGSVVASIGIVAARIAVTWIFTNPQPTQLILAVLAFLLALFLKFNGKGLWSQGFILISVLIVGVGLASLFGIYDWGKVAEAQWFMAPKLFPFSDFEGYTGPPVVFIAAAIIGGFAGYIGSMFESIGDYAATTAVCGEVYRVKHINKGIMAEGIGCVASGFLGALPVTSYTQNIGILAATGIASLHVIRAAAVMFLLYGLSPKLAMMLACIPRPIVGSVFLISASLIMFSGIDVIISEKRNMRNNLVAGTTIGLASMLPYYASTTGAKWVGTLHPFAKMFFNNNIFIAVVCGVTLNIILNILLRDKEI